MNEQLITPIIERFRKSKDIDLCFVMYLRVSGCWDILDTLAQDKQRKTIENADAATCDDMLKDKVLPRHIAKVLFPRIPIHTKVKDGDGNTLEFNAWACIKQLFDCIDEFKDLMTSYLNGDIYLIRKLDEWANAILNTDGEVRVITIFRFIDVWGNCGKRLDRESSQDNYILTNGAKEGELYKTYFKANSKLYIEFIKKVRSIYSDDKIKIKLKYRAIMDAFFDMLKTNKFNMYFAYGEGDKLYHALQADVNVQLQCSKSSFRSYQTRCKISDYYTV